jgi:hypothetical protein
MASKDSAIWEHGVLTRDCKFIHVHEIVSCWGIKHKSGRCPLAATPTHDFCFQLCRHPVMFCQAISQCVVFFVASKTTCEKGKDVNLGLFTEAFIIRHHASMHLLFCWHCTQLQRSDLLRHSVFVFVLEDGAFEIGGCDEKMG